MSTSHFNLDGKIDSEAVLAVKYILDNLEELRGRVGSLNFVTPSQLQVVTNPQLIRKELSASGSAPLNVTALQGLLAQSQPAVTIGTRANRPAAGISNTNMLYVASDLNDAIYVSNGTAWTLMYGMVNGTISPDQKPTGIDTTDTGLLFNSTDFDRIYRWGGAAWSDAPGQPQRDVVEMCRTAPAGNGWHLCDGTAGVTISKSDGTTTTITVPAMNAATFPRGNAAYSGPAATAAVAPGISGSTANTTPTNNAVATGVTVDSATAGITLNSHTTAADTAVAGAATRLTGPASHIVTDPGHLHGITDPTHNHTQNAHLHTAGTLAVDATGLPKLMDFLFYIRL